MSKANRQCKGKDGGERRLPELRGLDALLVSLLMYRMDFLLRFVMSLIYGAAHKSVHCGG